MNKVTHTRTIASPIEWQYKDGDWYRYNGNTQVVGGVYVDEYEKVEINWYRFVRDVTIEAKAQRKVKKQMRLSGRKKA